MSVSSNIVLLKLTHVLMTMFAVDAWNCLELLMNCLRVVGRRRRVLGRMRGIVLWWGQTTASTKRVSERSSNQRAMSSKQGTSFLSASAQLKVGVKRVATQAPIPLTEQSQADNQVN